MEKSMKSCSNSQVIETQKRMMKNIESWCDNGECWIRVFLSWNRSNRDLYGKFPRELKARAREKGIDIIIDTAFCPSLIDEHHRVFHRRRPVSFVFVSVDYLQSRSCLLELSSMFQSGLSLVPIAYYTNDELEESPHLQGDEDDFMDRARITIGSNGHDRFLIDFFCNFFYQYLEPAKGYNPLSAREDGTFLDTTIHDFTWLAFEWLPDYNIFCKLDHLAEQIHLFMSQPTEVYPVMYLGFVSSNVSYNTFAAHSVCSSARISGFIPYSLNLRLNCSHTDQNDEPYQDLFDKGLYFVDCLLKTSLYFNFYNRSRSLYKSLLAALPKKEKCIFLIENVPYYDYLKAMVNVLDFVSPDSRIIFTTTNENFFCSTQTFNRMPLYGSDGLPTLYCRKG